MLKLNILFVSDVSISKATSGAERVLFEQTIRLQRKGYNVHILTRKLPSHKSDHQIVQGVNEWRYDVYQSSPFSFNFGLKKSASIFLGDAGSTFIGFILAALAIKGDWADNSWIVSFSAPVLIFWILIYDMAYITIERIVTGKVKSLKEWIDYVGTDHIHHRLYKFLGDKRKAVLFIYFLCATLGISAITLRYARPIDGVLLVVQAFLITVIVSIAEYSGRKR